MKLPCTETSILPSRLAGFRIPPNAGHKWLSIRKIRQIDQQLKQGFKDEDILVMAGLAPEDAYLLRDTEHGFCRPDITGRPRRMDKMPETPGWVTLKTEGQEQAKQEAETEARARKFKHVGRGRGATTTRKFESYSFGVFFGAIHSRTAGRSWRPKQWA